jgi:hypothetical protein
MVVRFGVLKGVAAKFLRVVRETFNVSKETVATIFGI